MSNDTEELLTAFRDSIDRVQQRTASLRELLDAREKNRSPSYMTDEELSSLDAGIKKNTAMKKKLSTISEKTCEVVCKDIGSLNQSKFLAEAATALLQATTKASAVQWVLKAAQEMHRRYAAFKEAFLTALSKELSSDLDLADATAVSKRRACMKLALHVDKAALCKGLHMLRPAMKQIARVDLKKRDGTPVAALSLLTSLVRSSQDYLFSVTVDVVESLPAQIQDLTSLRSSDNKEVAQNAQKLADAIAEWKSLDSSGAAADAAQATALVEAVQSVFSDACTALEQWHEDLRAREKKNAKLQLARGAVPDSVQQAFDEQKTKFAAFQSGLEALGSALGRPLPELKVENATEDSDAVHIVANAGLAGSPDGLWDDDHMAYFYTNLPNLTSVVPSMALNNGKDAEMEEGASGEVDAAAGSGGGGGPGSDAGGGGGGGGDTGEGEDVEPTPKGEEEEGAAPAEEGAGEPTGIRAIYEQLAACTTSERADETAINFCLIQTKNRRKIMAQYLSDLHKVPLQVLPFYARVTATLSQQYADIGTAVGAAVARKVRGLAKKVDATHKTAEPRTASARYLAELAKFRVVDPGEFFVCLKRCLDDFSGHNIDTACELVVATGAFMMRQADTRERMESMLGVMMRHRTSRQLDAAKAWNIENAYLACNPRTQAAAPEKRTPLQRYIHKLLFSCVQQQEVKVDKLVRHLRRLPWEECEREVLKCTLEAAVSGSFERIQNLAGLIAALNKYRPSLVLALVDTLIEEVISGLQQPSMHTPQASIACTRLLCELYNFQVIKTSHLFNILYLYLTIGHGSPEESEMLDPRDSYVRTRSIFTILQASGHYFKGGNAHAKLKKYFVFLQCYLLAKEELPADLQVVFYTLHGKLLPETEVFKTQEAAEAGAREYVAAGAAWEKSGSGEHDQHQEEEDDAEDGEGEGNPQENDGARDNQQPADVQERQAAAVEDTDAADQAEDDLFEKELASIIPGQVSRQPVKDVSESTVSSSVCFRVRLKKHNARGDQTHRLELPASSTIAAHLNEHRTEEELERTRMKELVLAAEANLTPDQPPLSEHGRRKDLGRRKQVVRAPDTTTDDEGLPGVFRNVRGHL